MRNLKSQLAVWLALLGLCSLMPGAMARLTLPTGIDGSTGSSPNQISTVQVCRLDGTPVVSVQAQMNGFFEVILPPGTYVLTPYYMARPFPGQPIPEYVLRGASKEVTVTQNHLTSVNLSAASFPLAP